MGSGSWGGRLQWLCTLAAGYGLRVSVPRSTGLGGPRAPLSCAIGPGHTHIGFLNRCIGTLVRFLKSGILSVRCQVAATEWAPVWRESIVLHSPWLQRDTCWAVPRVPDVPSWHMPSRVSPHPPVAGGRCGSRDQSVCKPAAPPWLRTLYFEQSSGLQCNQEGSAPRGSRAWTPCRVGAPSCWRARIFAICYLQMRAS